MEIEKLPILPFPKQTLEKYRDLPAQADGKPRCGQFEIGMRTTSMVGVSELQYASRTDIAVVGRVEAVELGLNGGDRVARLVTVSVDEVLNSRPGLRVSTEELTFLVYGGSIRPWAAIMCDELPARQPLFAPGDRVFVYGDYSEVNPQARVPFLRSSTAVPISKTGELRLQATKAYSDREIAYSVNSLKQALRASSNH